MQDGQNLFDQRTSFSGEWEIDEFLDTQPDAGIVIGIDNGGDARIREYNPNDSEEFGPGLGREYLHRVVTILKPYVDERFRTRPDAAHTAIAGSSMGGLISFYAGLFHPDVFGSVGVFSPSFWMVDSLERQLQSLPANGYAHQRYYFYGGGKEGEDMVERLRSVQAVMDTKLGASVTLRVREKGIHAESAWRRMFPDFYAWLRQSS
jgi:predicted alpha/beta superfamily hydrolase